MPTADNTPEDTTVSEDTTAEVVDTSTNEDTHVDVDLENDDTSFEDVDDEKDESDDSEDEELDTEPAESEEESKEDEEQSDEAESSDEEANGVDTTPEDVKRHNAEMAARRIAERQAREAAKQQSQEEYLQSAEDDQDYALRQLQVEAYNTRVERVTNKLENGIGRAVNDIELFRTGSQEVKEELARRLDAFEATYVTRSQAGDPIDVKGDVYEYLQNEADSIRRIMNNGARDQVKAKSKAKARTDSLPTRAPKEPKVDPDLAAFDEEVAKWS